ncbi:hypothetical protein D9Q98_004028 [Chlorella vulgaris]|uniref:Uncharacterized protein n=1 Tax=Chlorella vulgaris TaxID=3077 RepID=A0A9D4TR66_CHLVU|nr:hypothetical protein D9Q98_004028 [Chlorella vulgaris]
MLVADSGRCSVHTRLSTDTMESDKSEKELNAMQHKELVAYALDLQNRQKGTSRDIVKEIVDALGAMVDGEERCKAHDMVTPIVVAPGSADRPNAGVDRCVPNECQGMPPSQEDIQAALLTPGLPLDVQNVIEELALALDIERGENERAMERSVRMLITHGQGTVKFDDLVNIINRRMLIPGESLRAFLRSLMNTSDLVKADDFSDSDEVSVPDVDAVILRLKGHWANQAATGNPHFLSRSLALP